MESPDARRSVSDRRFRQGPPGRHHPLAIGPTNARVRRASPSAQAWPTPFAAAATRPAPAAWPVGLPRPAAPRHPGVGPESPSAKRETRGIPHRSRLPCGRRAPGHRVDTAGSPTDLTPANAGSRQGQMDTSSLLPGSESWQRKLASLGMIYEQILDQRVRYGVDSARHVDEPGSTRTVTWSLVIPDDTRPFVDMIKRAIAAEAIRRGRS